MSDLKLVGGEVNDLPDEKVDILKGKKFVAIYIDDDKKYRCHKSRVSDEEVCYMLSLALNLLFDEEP